MPLKDIIFGKDRYSKSAHRLYVAVVEQARNPVFYSDLGVPDSLDGRFELISLHTFLVLHRLKSETGEAGLAIGQGLVDLMFADMDQSLREMGVGDMGVGKRVKKMAEAFQGRVAAYSSALVADEETQLHDALRRNLFGTRDQVEAHDLGQISDYLRHQAAFLGQQKSADILQGIIAFSQPGQK
ncbi:ubiquinol-cytochrome C chaperone family protein [Limibacillus halophilus]|uniref:Cytochrome b pre-mRNA-processing protein 3 n=1 Tax=Limibacillus halophilus TaxID=1579333 RepID=A0A839SSG4_9PROT|nr:ubiquinol-cytochrome C chaperone family protein [Limibacillus halophilus]MBB3065741.1 cytochrome b pre-mRNA-processing protein 3 [Limibacillus halophilus]